MAPSLASAGIAGDGYPRNISAGDGSEVAFQRIRAKQYQSGAVAEPLRLQGWQIVDEMNRALAGEPPSGYVPPTNLFTPDTIQFDGGPNNIDDPDNGYTNAYKKIWGVSSRAHVSCGPGSDPRRVPFSRSRRHRCRARTCPSRTSRETSR